MKNIALSLATLSIFCTATLAVQVVADTRIAEHNHNNARQTVLAEHTVTHYSHQEALVQVSTITAARRVAIQEAVRLAKEERNLAVQLAKERTTTDTDTPEETQPRAKKQEKTTDTPTVSTAPEPTEPKRVPANTIAPSPAPAPTVTPPPITTIAVPTEEATEPYTVTDTYLVTLVQEIHKLTNLERQGADIAVLAYSDTLASVATAHSEDMATRDYFSHDSPEGCNAGCRLQAADYSLLAWGENIAWRDTVHIISAEDLAAHFVEAWINSPGHRRNLLSENFTHEGIGASVIDDTVYVTVNFAKPR